MKLKINNDLLAEEFFENTHLLGIVAPVKNYQFIWHINQSLGYTFRLNSDFEIELRKKTRSYFFSIYEYQIPQTTIVHYLYHNQHMGEYLLPEFKHLDFLWLIRGEDLDMEEINQLQQSIKKIPQVQFVNEVAADKIKNKLRLIF
jgi:hypothetical protein